MARIEVHKFGGTSVGSTERILCAARILVEASSASRICAVSSAMSGVTDQLLAAAASAAGGDLKAARKQLDQLRNRHDTTLTEIASGPDPEVGGQIGAILDEVGDLLEAVSTTRELSARVRDRIVASGEKMAVRLLSRAIRALGTDSVALDADTFLATDGNHGEADPVSYTADEGTAKTVRPVLDRKAIAIVTGFCGRGPDGATTTLGRGGSDFSATLVGAALKADEVIIWTDVSGVYSTDPRIVPGARSIAQLHYREAAEMSYYGAKVLHPRTMIPITAHRIPVRVKNSHRPSDDGTLVNDKYTPGPHPVKAVSAVRAQALVSIEGKGMAGVPGVAGRAFSCLARERINVTMISQSSSEATITLAVPEAEADRSQFALKGEFRRDIDNGSIEDVKVEHQVGLIAAVGLGMAHTPGIAARVFRALARRRVNVLAIAQGSSELNISLAVAGDDVNAAVRAIHDDFNLESTRDDAFISQPIDVAIMGFGQVGRKLMELIHTTRDASRETGGPYIRIVAVCDRSGYIFNPHEIAPDHLTKIAAQKARGTRLCDLDTAHPIGSPEDFVKALTGKHLTNPILVDSTDHGAAATVFGRAFEAGMDVVTANKEPLACDDGAADVLDRARRKSRRLLRGEATVGAGLPILDTVNMLTATGDRISRIEGCLSGTLGLLMTRIEDGALLHEAVEEAVRLGYTEPDPAIDLTGRDVARKAIILGRLSNLAPSASMLRCNGLLGDDAVGLDAAALRSRLESLGTELDAQMKRAHASGNTLRFVATIETGSMTVGVREVPKDSPLGRLRGTGNMAAIYSDRYAEDPLVVAGRGAGADVTASALLWDVLRIAGVRTMA